MADPARAPKGKSQTGPVIVGPAVKRLVAVLAKRAANDNHDLGASQDAPSSPSGDHPCE